MAKTTETRRYKQSRPDANDPLQPCSARGRLAVLTDSILYRRLSSRYGVALRAVLFKMNPSTPDHLAAAFRRRMDRFVRKRWRPASQANGNPHGIFPSRSQPQLSGLLRRGVT